MRLKLALLIAAVGMLAVGGRRADAYPQYQMSKEQTCTACHLSPAGGELLNENGYNVAEATSQYGTAPEFMYNLLPLPSWLALGGDLRSAAGYFKTADSTVTAIPMQADVYARAAYKNLSFNLTVGVRPPQYITNNGSPGVPDLFWSREHYLTWQQNEGSGEGLFVRAGRFMPVFGLRLAEHPDYTRRYGGVPLYGETYAAAVEYIKPSWEVHLTGFLEDPIIDLPVRGSGAALYAEVRPSSQLAIGYEAMSTTVDGNTKLRAGLTGKLFLESAGILLEGELQAAHQQVDGPGAPNQIIGYFLASRAFGSAFLLDVGYGHYDENLAIRGLDRDNLDANLHWFTTSHLELVLQSRIEGLGIGSDIGGQTGGWVLLHAHYRL
jgi:hypothetical protein